MIVWVKVIWMVGAFIVMLEAPSCPGFTGLVTRVIVSFGWPIMLTIVEVRTKVIGEAPRKLACNNGELNQRQEGSK